MTQRDKRPNEASSGRQPPGLSAKALIIAALLALAAVLFFVLINGSEEEPQVGGSNNYGGETALSSEEAFVPGGQAFASEDAASDESFFVSLEASLDYPAQSDPERAPARYSFRNEEYLEQHWEKHGGEFDYADKDEYLDGANRVINDPNALTKTEAEDGDYIFYLEETNEFVVLSVDGYIRTYFRPNSGIDYFNRQ